MVLQVDGNCNWVSLGSGVTSLGWSAAKWSMKGQPQNNDKIHVSPGKAPQRRGGGRRVSDRQEPRCGRGTGSAKDGVDRLLSSNVLSYLNISYVQIISFDLTLNIYHILSGIKRSFLLLFVTE